MTTKQDSSFRKGQSESEQAGTLVFGQALSMIAQAILPWIIVRLVEKADVGVFSSLMLIYSTAAIILSSGFAPTLLYFNADRSRSERCAVTKKVFFVLTLLGGITSLLLYGLAHFSGALVPLLERYFSLMDSKEGETAALAATLQYLKLFALFPLLDMPSRLIPNLFISENMPRGAAFFGIFKAVSMSIAAVIPAALGFGLEGIVYGYLCFGFVQAIVMIAIIVLLYRGAGASDEKPVTVRRLFGFAVPLGMNDILNVINTSFDSYLILGTMSAAVFADYRMGAWQIPIVTSIAYSVGAVYTPRFVRLLKEHNPIEVIRLWRGSISRVSLIVVPVCMVFIVGAEEFVTLTLTSQYIGAAPIFRIYSIYTMGRVTAFSSVLLAADRSRYILWGTFLMFAMNVIISVPLLFGLGYIGPALGTLLNYIPQVIIFSYLISKALSVPFKQIFPVIEYLKIVCIAVLPAAVAIIPKYFLSHLPALAFAAEAVIILVGFSIIGTKAKYITSEDWRFVKGWIMGKMLFANRKK